MKLSPKLVSCYTAPGPLIVVFAAILHIRVAADFLRLLIAFVLLYGGFTLLGSAVEKAWARILGFMQRKQVKYPRAAAGTSLVIISILSETVLHAATRFHYCRLVAVFIAEAVFLIGGSLVVGKWLSAGWDVASSVLRKSPLSGDDF